jgi:hypothetical protein
MANNDSKADPVDLDPDDIESYLAMALEDIARVAWRLMTEEQKETFKAEPEILAITDAFGDFADDQNADF